MSNNPSHVTKAIALRLSNEVYDVLVRKATKQGIKPSEWVKKRLSYDLMRLHGKRRR